MPQSTKPMQHMPVYRQINWLSKLILTSRPTRVIGKGNARQQRAPITGEGNACHVRAPCSSRAYGALWGSISARTNWLM